MNNDDEFFNAYEKSRKETGGEGIRNFTMNEPITNNQLVGTLGLELEMEAKNSLPADGYLEAIYGEKSKARWMGVKDGSLRGSSKEFILTAPCTRDELPVLVTGLFSVIGTHKTILDNSNRCSTHVHVNMKGRKINELTSIIALWATFETLLIEWCGVERKTNHFCLSMQDSPSVPMAWESLLRYGAYPGDRNLKYSALNILPLWEKGSLEFRCGRAADSPAFPILWATFLDVMCEYAANTYKYPDRLAADLSERGGWNIFQALCATDDTLATFPDQVRGDLTTDEFDLRCLHNFRSVQGFTLEYPWGRWLELIERPFVPNPFGTKKKSKVAFNYTRPVGQRIAENRGIPPEDRFVVPPEDRPFHQLEADAVPRRPEARRVAEVLDQMNRDNEARRAAELEAQFRAQREADMQRGLAEARARLDADQNLNNWQIDPFLVDRPVD